MTHQSFTLAELFSVDIAALAIVGFAVYRYALSQVPAQQTLAEQRATSFAHKQSLIVANTALSKFNSIFPWS